MNYDISSAPHNFSQLLKTELKRIQESSPRFSMRSFAKKLSVSQTELSEVINKKRKPSSRLVLNFFRHFSKNQAEYLHHVSNLNIAGIKLKKKDKHLFKLEEEQYKMISQWQHYAILSLIETHDFIPDYDWIANRLGESREKIELCLQNLRFLGLIKFDKNNHLVLTHEGIKTSDELTSKAIKESHLADLGIINEKIQASLDVDKRDFTSCTYAVNSKNIKKFKQLVRKFQDQVAELVEDKNADEVYRMSIYFYPLTQIRTKEKI